GESKPETKPCGWPIAVYTQDIKRVSEGDPVTLSCKYSVSSVTDYALQWYHQYSRSRPEFIDYIFPSQTDKDSVLLGMSVNLDKNQSRVDLLISFATISNSALYYCALAPTVTGNPAIMYKKLPLKIRLNMYDYMFIH
uniref:Ig-like domain-containing protein n=1 Tax=Electrophorus electricus TaxID=8005 RepID=A0AAY5F1H1_ELEEL